LSRIVQKLKEAKALVIDFDGTLVDSNEIKWKAFETCLSDFSEHLWEIRAYCRDNNHTPRQEKFRHIFEKILKRPYTKEDENRFMEMFARETTERIVAAPEIPGALQFLRSFTPSRRTALLSNTPHEILLTILGRRELTGFFQEIQGAPIHKRDWISAFKNKLGMQGGEVVFLGDTFEDAKAAKEAGCIFLGVGNEALRQNVPYFIRNFEELPHG
jgi:phosphoglycolate phosphatase-like HAD superfamily hydrolase